MNRSPLNLSEKLAIGILAATSFLLHLIINLTGAYGFFRDELYYIACSDHLDIGYVDQPPLCAYVLKISRMLLGDSLAAIRFFPALAISGTILLTGLITKRLGGGLFAIFLACLAVSCSPIHLAMGSFYSMNSIDIFIWSSAFLFILKIVQEQSNGSWVWLGIILGIGLLNKISVLFLGAGIFIGFLFTPERKWYSKPWPYVAGIIALILFAPYIIWNATHEWAHLEFIKNASEGKYSGRSRVDFLLEQLSFLNPLNFPIYIIGLFALFQFKSLKSFKLLGWIYLTAFAILFINRTSKGEYLVPAYTILFAAGGVYIEYKLSRSSLTWIKVAYPSLIIALTLVVLPMVLPLLPVESFIKYSAVLGAKPSSNEGKELALLPQFYADMFGWEDKTKVVAQVFNSLLQEDKQKCAILASNYGRCGAIDFFGEKYGLPKSIGNHNNYWIWGPRKYTGEVMIILGGTIEDHKENFQSCEIAAKSTCKYCMPYENNLNIFICRGLKQPLKQIWLQEKHYD